LNCTKCGKTNPSDNKFCEQCGTPLDASGSNQPIANGSECPACKHPNPSGSAFCEGCGASMQNPASSAPPTPVIPAPITPAPVITPAIQTPSTANAFLVLPDNVELPIQTRRTIGRLDLAKYASPNEVMWLSRQHFDIFDENGAYYIIDEKSGNGTKLNGVEIKQKGKQALKDGDQIFVGDAVKVSFKVKTQ
jgi:hypothetical protein